MMRMLPNDLADRLTAGYHRAVHSWLLPLLIVFAVFAAAVLLLDDFPIQADGLLSIHTVGYTDEIPNVPDIIDRLINKSQQHVPGYFLTLFVWAEAVGWSPLALRLLTVFFGILSLALMYRLGRGCISKEAGLFSLVMLASLTFYNIWYLPIRMYTMFVAAELLLLWVYFRMLQRSQVRRWDYVWLFLACLVFINAHTFSLTVFVGLGLYHLLLAPKTRRWYGMTAAALLAVLVILPWFVILFQGAEYYASNPDRTYRALNPIEMTVNIVSLGTNANLLFAALLLLSVKQALDRDRLAIAFWVILIVAIALYALINLAVQVADPTRFRYFVSLFPLMILLMVKGLEQLKKWKFLTVGILLFWIASGLLYHRRVGPDFYVRSYDTIPIHLIERHLRDEFRAGDLVTGWTDGLDFNFRTVFYGSIVDFYFAEHDDVSVAVQNVYQLKDLADDEIAALILDSIDDRERVWLAYELDKTGRYDPLYRSVLYAHYQRCRFDETLPNVVIELYQKDCG